MRIILPSPLRIALLLALAICYSDIAEAAAPAGQWWSAASSYRQKITVTTGASAPVNRYNGYSVARTFDTAALVTASKMQADCDDLRVLWWNGTGWVELDRDISGCNTASTQIWFKLQADIADSASDDNYYIYYGNASATAGPANKNNVYVYYDDFESNSLGAAPSGWSVIAGNATVESDAGDKALRMNSASANSRVNLIKNISPTEKDILVEADCKIDTSVTTNGYCGVGSRFSGTNAANETGYMGDIRYNTDQSLSQRYVSGAWTGIGSLNEAVTRGVYYRVRLTTVGTTIKMYRDGTLKTNNTDAGISAANMLGIDAYNSATGVYEFLDNYLARRFVEPEPTAAAASEEKILSGTAYADEGVTNVGAGKTVRLIKNGADAGSTVTDASGAYSIAAVVNAGDALLVYIDNDVAYKGTTASVSNGASLASFDIYATHLVTRHDNAGTLTNALLSTAKGPYTDADILYSVAAGNLTVSGAGTELYVLTGHGFAPGGNVTTPALENRGSFDGGTGVINVNGDFTQAGGTFTATTGTLTITIGNWTMSGGTFNPNGGTVVFGDATSGGKTITGSLSLNHVTFNSNSGGGSVWTIAAGTTLTVAGTFTFDNSSIGGTVINTGTLAAQGNIVVADANSYTGTALLLINGAGAQSFTGSATQAAGSVPNVQINKPSGTLTLAGTLRTNNNWTYTAGTLDPGTSTVVFGDPLGGSQTITGSHSLNHVTFDSNTGGGRTWVVAAGTTLTVAGTLTFDNSSTGSMTINTGTLAAQGNVTVLPPQTAGSAVLLFSGTANQLFDLTGAIADFNLDIQVNKTGGRVDLASALTLDAANQDLTIQQGTFDLAGNNLTVSGAGSTFVVLNGGNLQLQGGETTTLPTLNAGSTVTYDGAGSYASLAAGNGYSNLTFNGAGSWTHTAPLTVNGNFTVTSGTLNSAGQNVTVTGNWSNSGTYTSGANTVTFNGANQSISGNTTFNHFTKSVISADTLTFAAGSATTINGTATLNGASGQLLSLRSSTPGTRWNFTLPASATKAISYVDVRDSDASGSVAALLSINPPNSSDSGNNVAWFAITVTGTVYTDEGITNIGAGKTVRLLKNGVSLGTAATDAAGAFGFNADIATGDALLLYIDGNDGVTTDATTVTVSPGGATSNLNLYVDHLITRHDNAGTLTNALMSTAKGAYSDTEILYAVSGGNLTVSGTGTVLFVPSGHSFAPGGNVTTPRLAIVATAGLTAGGATITLTATGTPFAVNGSFAPGGSTVRYTGSGAPTNIAAAPYNHLQLAPSGVTTYSLAGPLTGPTALTGDLTVDTNATLDATASNYNLTAVNMTINGTYTARDSNISVGGNWDHSAGTFTSATSHVVLTGTGTLKTAAAIPDFYELSLAAAGRTTTLDSNIETSLIHVGGGAVNTTAGVRDIHVFAAIDDAADIAPGAVIDVGEFYIEATTNVSQKAIAYGGAGRLRFRSTSTVTMTGDITLTGATVWVQRGTVNLNGNNLTNPGALVLGYGSVNHVGILYLGSGTVSVGGSVFKYESTFGTNSELYLQSANVSVGGNWDATGVAVSGGSSTVTFTGANQSISGNTTFNNFTKSVTAADTLTFAAGSTTSVAAGGKLTFTGAPGNLLRLRSGTPGTGWFLNVGAGVAPVANYVDVQDSNAGGGQTIYAYYSTDSLRNTNWVFGQQLQLVKQVWDLAGNCLASRPADAACNGGLDTVTVPAATGVRFLIFVRNPMAVTAPDLRLQDLIDDSGFTYQAGSLRRGPVDGTAPADTATLATLHAAATVVQTDARDGAIQVDEFAGIDTAASPDNLTVGGSGGASDNDTLALPANKTFVLAFRAAKN